MTTVPAVSIVMAVRDGERYLEPMLASIAAQTFRDFELLIVNDRSTDRSTEIAREWTRKDPRMRLLETATPGISGTRNTGIHAARARWLAVTDHDDLWLPAKLERQMAYLATSSGVVGLGTWGHYIGTRGRVAGLHAIGPTTLEEFQRTRKAGEIARLLSPAVIFDREALLRCGAYRPEFDGAEDIDLYERIAEFGALLTLPEVLYRYRIHSHSMSTRKIAMQHSVTRFLEHNLRERNAGRPPIELEEFVKRPGERSVVSRFLHWRRALGASLYRRAGGFIADRSWLRGGFLLLCAALATPEYVVGKLRGQRRSRWRRGPEGTPCAS